jgi:integrase/recombinase XerD
MRRRVEGGGHTTLPIRAAPPVGVAPLAVATEDRVAAPSRPPFAVERGAVADPARHPALVYLARLAPGSRRTIEQSLHVVARALGGDDATLASFPWHLLRYQHTAALRAACWDRYAPATTNKLMAAVRGVLHEAWRLRLIDADDYRRAADVRGVRGANLLHGRALSAGELRALFAHCSADPSPLGARDAALLGVLYGGGLRRAEVVALDLNDYDAATAAIRVMRGKGRKARLSYVRGGAAAALDEWVGMATRARLQAAAHGPRPEAPPPSDAVPLFTRIRRGGTITTDRLTPSGVLLVLQRRARAAGVASFSPHDVRRTFIGDLLDAGADISTVQRLAGHANVQTTARYDRRDERTKHAAAALLHVPFAPRAREQQP